MSRDYRMQIVAIIHKSRKTYGVSFPDLPGCIATGATQQEAMTNAADAVAAHLENMHDHGDPIPVPRDLDQLRGDAEFADDFEGHEAVALVPYFPPSKSVRVNITLDEHLLTAIDRAAETGGMTRSGYLSEAARARLRGK